MIKRNEKPLIEQKVQIQDALQATAHSNKDKKRGGGGFYIFSCFSALARVEGVVWGVQTQCNGFTRTGISSHNEISKVSKRYH